jgi:hypothetical protein
LSRDERRLTRGSWPPRWSRAWERGERNQFRQSRSCSGRWQRRQEDQRECTQPSLLLLPTLAQGRECVGSTSPSKENRRSMMKNEKKIAVKLTRAVETRPTNASSYPRKHRSADQGTKSKRVVDDFRGI